MKKIAIMLLITLFATNSIAAWSTSQPIKMLKAQGNGIVFSLDGFVNTDTTIQCTFNNFFFLEEDTAASSNYQARVSFLLSVFMSDKTLSFSYYGCTSDNKYVLVSSIKLVRPL